MTAERTSQMKLREMDEGERRYWQKRIMSVLSGAGVSNRTERLIRLSLLFARPILSTDDLTRAEARAFRDAYHDERGRPNIEKFRATMERQDNGRHQTNLDTP